MAVLSNYMREYNQAHRFSQAVMSTLLFSCVYTFTQAWTCNHLRTRSSTNTHTNIYYYLSIITLEVRDKSRFQRLFYTSIPFLAYTSFRLVLLAYKIRLLMGKYSLAPRIEIRTFGGTKSCYNQG